MPSSTPQYTIAKPTGGVLPISAVTNAQTDGAKPAGQAKGRHPASRLKVVVRRLPPGLTEAEFKAAIGEEWMPESGKVDWFRYNPGKLSKDLAKPSKPSRAYFRTTEQSYLETLSEKVRQTSFADARNTFNDAALLGPPVLEFAPYGRVPTGKRRNDARQGLIDQDSEFIEFLESLTNPIVKPNTVDALATAEASEKKDEVVTVTPLIQHLRDKKAAKEKGAASKTAKHSRQTSKADNAEAKADGKSSKTTKDGSETVEKKSSRSSRSERASKIVKKETVTAQTKQKATTATSSAENSKPAQEGSSRKSEAPSHAAAAARMIQRDLGIRGGRGAASKRGGRATTDQKATTPATTPTTSEKAPSDKTDSVPDPSSKPSEEPDTTAQPQPSAASAEPSTSTEPSSSRKQANTTTTNPPSKPSKKPPPTAATAPNQSAKSAAAPAQPNPTATQAFLKHANPSQGITEPLLEEAMAVFGVVTKVEIDKRKGFAYVDFTEPVGLQKAMAASPVKVAQGSVQVLERKERPAAKAAGAARAGAAAATPRGGATLRGARGGRGRGGSARGGAAVGATTAAGTAVEGDAKAAKTEEQPSGESTAAAAAEVAKPTV